MDQGERAPGMDSIERDEREEHEWDDRKWDEYERNDRERNDQEWNDHRERPEHGTQVADVIHMYAMNEQVIERGIKWRCEQLMDIVKNSKRPLNALDYVKAYFNSVEFDDWGDQQ